MGWERKRGKLDELNAPAARRDDDTSFLTPEAGRVRPRRPDVRYVVTLDADTRLPREAARRLVGTIAHPLNRPTFDARPAGSIDGYGVLQPRMTPTLPAEARGGSIFQRLFSGPAGIDPYASAVSDVYQDLFGEGSYTGKGIYDVDAFERGAGRPRARERAAEPRPVRGRLRPGRARDRHRALRRVPVATTWSRRPRQHRWARGDWQLLPWILGRARDATGGAPDSIPRHRALEDGRQPAPHPVGARRRSPRSSPAWTLPPARAGLWTAFVLAALVRCPPALPVLAGLLPRRRGISKRSHLRAVGADVGARRGPDGARASRSSPTRRG